MRGANQSLVGFSSADWADCADSAGASGAAAPGAAALGAGAGRSPVVSVLSAVSSPSATGLRTTTGGMGRDPGMLIRIRVVSVVSVLRSSGRVAERPASAPASEAVGVP
ncbi:hypothetical protein B0E38_04320 [Streptomyces sp. 111WW2]|nr:hypothetical protein [Streptomyces lividans]KKD13342.1 hypothetical protein TR66_21430 [Streptomyces sp. WM6391]PSK53379.1 hypothetical protein B0E38_04320 [Streptomyces sp. 111WW2]